MSTWVSSYKDIRFLELTKVPWQTHSDKEHKVYVNPEHIVSLRDITTPECCEVMLATGNIFYVKEKANDIIDNLRYT